MELNYYATLHGGTTRLGLLVQQNARVPLKVLTLDNGLSDNVPYRHAFWSRRCHANTQTSWGEHLLVVIQTVPPPR